MAINGEKWLKLNKRESLYISEHSLDRIYKRSGIPISRDEAIEQFLNAKLVDDKSFYFHGYRWDINNKKNREGQTFHFVFHRNDLEHVAVICITENKVAWVTTLIQDKHSNYLRGL